MAQEIYATEPLVVTIYEAAKMLSVGHQVIRRMIHDKEIPEDKVTHVGSHWRINRRYILTLAGETK